jgi:hypothetical protein
MAGVTVGLPMTSPPELLKRKPERRRLFDDNRGRERCRLARADGLPAAGRYRLGYGLHSHFEPTSDSVTAARHSMRRRLGGLPDGVIERVELIVSELATNAVCHAGTPST